MLDLILEANGHVDSDLFLISCDQTRSPHTHTEVVAAAIKGGFEPRSSVSRHRYLVRWSTSSSPEKMKLLVVLFAVLAVSSAGLADLLNY